MAISKHETFPLYFLQRSEVLKLAHSNC